MIEFYTHTVSQTIQIGRILGKLLKKGDMVCLCGELGVGKTAFTSGIALGLGVTDAITSPTFTLVNEYEGRVPLYHFDVYRIGSAGELWEIGFEEYIAGAGIVVIEWPDRILEILPHQRIEVTITKNLKNFDERTICISIPDSREKDLGH